MLSDRLAIVLYWGSRILGLVIYDITSNSLKWIIVYFLILFAEMLLQYFVEAGAIAVRRVRKEDIRHVAKATGATVVCFFLSSNDVLVDRKVCASH